MKLYFFLVGLIIGISSIAQGMNQNLIKLNSTEWDQKSYNDDIQYNLVEELIKNCHLDKLFVGKKCLDMGCGKGRVTRLFKDLVEAVEVRGIDQSATMIEYAKTMYGDLNLTFEHQDVSECVGNCLYGGIVSFFTLHWIKDKKTVIKNIFTMLKPGGHFFATCDAPVEREHEGNMIATLMQEFPAFKEVFMSNPVNEILGRWRIEQNDMSDLLRESGFERFCVQLHNVELKFTKETFAAFQRAQVMSRPFIAYIPEQQREKLFERFVELTCEKLEKDKEGNFIYPYVTLVMEAHKR